MHVRFPIKYCNDSTKVGHIQLKIFTILKCRIIVFFEILRIAHCVTVTRDNMRFNFAYKKNRHFHNISCEESS